MSRYNRTNFYKKEIVNGILENDLLLNYFDDYFVVNRPTGFYTLKNIDLRRPDSVSRKLYGVQDFWWILSKFNNIDDWWNDVEAGSVIRIPNILDIEDFYLRVKTKIKSEQ